MTRNPAFIAAFFAAMIITACFTAKGAGPAKLQVTGFGKSKEGRNKKGLEAVVITYDAALVSLRVPNRSGRIADIVLGYDDVNRYEQDKSYFGTTIRRYGNRIAGGQFTLDGIGFHLPKNDRPNSLHGGIQGFNKRVWMDVDRPNEDAQVLELSIVSQDEEEATLAPSYDRTFLDGTARDKSGQVSGQRTGFCMETQHFPDSLNHRNFPSAELRCSNLSVNDSLQA